MIAVARATALRLNRVRPAVGAGFVLFVASAATVQKYGGTTILLLYFVMLVGGAAQGARAVELVRERLSERAALVVAALLLLALAVVFALVYPHANTHAANAGTDRDDAADIGARLLLHGHYPYTGRTYLGQTISQLPGALFLAAPFVLIGKSAYAAFFWLPVFFVLLRVLSREWRLPLLLMLVALALSPAFLREIVTGGDLVANGIWVAACVALVWAARRPAALGVASVLLGVLLSSRLNFLFVLPPLLVALARRSGLRRAGIAATLVAAGFAAITLPFVLHSGPFTPLTASNHLSRFDGVIPGGATTVGVLVGLGALSLALRARTLQDVFVQAAAVQVVLVLSVVVLSSAQSEGIDFSPLVPGYGLLGLFFGLAAAARPRPDPV